MRRGQDRDRTADRLGFGLLDCRGKGAQQCVIVGICPLGDARRDVHQRLAVGTLPLFDQFGGKRCPRDRCRVQQTSKARQGEPERQTDGGLGAIPRGGIGGGKAAQQNRETLRLGRARSRVVGGRVGEFAGGIVQARDARPIGCAGQGLLVQDR